MGLPACRYSRVFSFSQSNSMEISVFHRNLYIFHGKKRNFHDKLKVQNPRKKILEYFPGLIKSSTNFRDLLKISMEIFTTTRNIWTQNKTEHILDFNFLTIRKMWTLSISEPGNFGLRIFFQNLDLLDSEMLPHRKYDCIAFLTLHRLLITKFKPSCCTNFYLNILKLYIIQFMECI